MGLSGRHYLRDDDREPGAGFMQGMTMGMPRLTPGVKFLLIANAAVFVVQMFLDRPREGGHPMSAALGVTVGGYWQIWRYVTFQFLHADYWHILLNMLGVYMLGVPLEQHFGTRRFMVFYLSCGVVAGIAYVVIGAVFGGIGNTPIIGASGGVYAIVLACAVLFPNFKIIFLFFPVPIRLAAVIIFGGMILLVLQSLAQGQAWNAMSDVAHLGGAAAAAFWIWGLPRVAGTLGTARERAGRGAWQRKENARAALQEQVDAILDKVHRAGIQSLTRKEKNILQEETRRQQRQGRG